MPQSGIYRNVITIQRQTTETDGIGSARQGEWYDLIQLHVAIEEAYRPIEQVGFKSAAVAAMTTYWIKFRPPSQNISVKDRCVLDGDIMEINSIRRGNVRNEMQMLVQEQQP